MSSETEKRTSFNEAADYEVEFIKAVEDWVQSNIKRNNKLQTWLKTSEVSKDVLTGKERADNIKMLKSENNLLSQIQTYLKQKIDFVKNLKKVTNEEV